jgi:hypothetical protein
VGSYFQNKKSQKPIQPHPGNAPLSAHGEDQQEHRYIGLSHFLKVRLESKQTMGETYADHREQFPWSLSVQTQLSVCTQKRRKEKKSRDSFAFSFSFPRKPSSVCIGMSLQEKRKFLSLVEKKLKPLPPIDEPFEVY